MRTRRPTHLALASLATLAASRAGAQAATESAPRQLVEATIAELRAAMQSGLLTAEGLTQRYLLRTAAYDQTGSNLDSMITVNPVVIDEARMRDRVLRQGGNPGPLFGIAVLLKDNIDALPMATTGGSLALVGSTPPDDAFVTRRLRSAGAVIFGKATLTEFANFMTTGGMPSGYSSLGGHGVNPYDPRRNPDGSAVQNPGGSSSGSGIAAAANLVTVAIGTETAGSILSPSSRNCVVGIKPTLGLVSRDGILPISADQDTAGPMARTVADAAIVLGVIAGHDPSDPATTACLTPGNCYSDYTQFLDRTALQGARIAVPPFQFGPQQALVMQAATATLRASGAFVAEPYPIPNLALRPVCLTYPPPVSQSTVLVFGMKRDLDGYLASLGPQAPIQSLAQIIAFNNANPTTALRYGQSILVAADPYDATPGSADEQRYMSDRQRDLMVSRSALDAVYVGPDGVPGTPDDFDAILFPANRGADAPARAGYPSIVVPGGFTTLSGRPPLPFGVTFSGPAFSEPRLLALAYAFEQATAHRLPPSSAPALSTDTIPLVLPGVRTTGNGCMGSNGIPAITTQGPPIIGNSAFALALSSLRPNALAFIGVSAAAGSQIIGSCGVYAVLPFQVVVPGSSTAVGNATIDLPLPWVPALVGQSLWLQGGAVDPLGGALGLVALTGGLELIVGG